MRQQVNLLADGFAKEQVPVSALQIAGATGALLVVLTLITFVTGLRTSSLETRVNRGAAQQEQATTEVEELTVRLEAHTADAALAGQVQGLEAKVQARQRLIALLGATDAGNVKGFSAYLRGLSEHPTTGVWLTGIELTSGGKYIALSGKTNRPENVPNFLVGIGQEEAFRGRQFDQFVVERDSLAENSDRMDFQIRSRPEARRR